MISQSILTLITAIFIGGAAGYIGSLMLTKRMALVGGPLGHLALPGVALALIYHFNIFLGALFSIFLGIFFIWFFETKTKLPLEALTGVVFASGVALGFLILPMSHAEEAIVGDITKVDLLDAFLAVGLGSVIFLATRKIYKKIVLTSISEDLARARQINIKKINFIYLLLIAFITALEVKIIGILLTAALFAIPASTARNLSKNLFQYSLFSTVIGIISALSGIILFKITNFPAGPLMILSSSLSFLLSLVFKRKKAY